MQIFILYPSKNQNFQFIYVDNNMFPIMENGNGGYFRIQGKRNPRRDILRSNL